MKIFFSSFAFILVFSALAFAQAEKPQAVAQSKIGVIDTDVFLDEKTGIQEFVEANKKLEDEFKSQKEEIILLVENHQEIVQEFQKINQTRGCVKISDEYINAKINELYSLERKIKSKREQAKLLYDKRKAEIFQPLYEKSRKALLEFSKQNGYAIILDKNKLESRMITGDFFDVTAEFIRFYNNLGEK